MGVLLSCAQTQAASFSAQRGVNLDIWVTWPGVESWANPDVILPYPEWRKHVKPEDLARLKADGFDFVRMPVDPAPFLLRETEELRAQLIESAMASVRIATEAGLKVIVDLHTIPRSESPGGVEYVLANDRQFDDYLDLVREIGKALSKEDPARVAFELMNEPTAFCEDASGWADRLKQLHAAARASATRLTLVLGGGCYDSAESLTTLDPKIVPDGNIIWTFHSYEPFLLTTQGASWAGDFIPYVTGIPYPPSSVSRAELDAVLENIRERMRNEAPLLRRSGLISYLDEQIALVDTDEELETAMNKPFDLVAAWADQHGVPPDNILLGEFGMITQDYGKPFVMPAKWRAAYVKDVVARAEAKGFAWSIWGYGGSFGIVDAFDGKKAERDVLDAIKALSPRLRTSLAN